MQITILSDGANVIGGADKVAISSAIGLARRGHKVHMISAIGPIDHSLMDVQNLTVECTNQHELAGLQFHKTRVWNQAAHQLLRSRLRSVQKEDHVVHSHCYFGMLSCSVIDAALSNHSPTLVTMHDYGIACPQRNFFHYKEGKVCRRVPLSLACICTNCTQESPKSKMTLLVPSIMQRYGVRLSKRIRNVAFVSSFSEQIIAPYLSKDCRRFAIANPVDAELSSRVSAEHNNAFVFIGRMVKEKAPTSVAIAARIAGVKAVFVGDGPEKEAVMRVNPEAECTGWLDSSSVHRILMQARAFIMPSIWYECAPLSTIEAQSHGLPVIVADTNASSDRIVHGKTGLIYRGGDDIELSKCMASMKDNDLVLRMSQNAYSEFWASPPTMEKHLDALETVYRTMLRSN